MSEFSRVWDCLCFVGPGSSWTDGSGLGNTDARLHALDIAEGRSDWRHHAGVRPSVQRSSVGTRATASNLQSTPLLYPHLTCPKLPTTPQTARIRSRKAPKIPSGF